MKSIIFLAVLLSLMELGHGQSYFVDVGAAATRERFQDGRVLVAPGTTFPEANLVVGLTNTSGFDQVVLTSLDNVYGTTNYQKKYKLSWPVLSKPADRIEVNSVRLAFDEAAGASNFLMVGSYLRKNSTGSTVLGRGIFTAFVNLASGNITSIKRWETSLSSVSHVAISKATVHAGTYYFTGNIYASGTPNHMLAVAINGSNNLI